MTSIIKCIALSGTEVEGAPCCLLQIDEFKLLMDCGVDPSLDLTYLHNLKKLSHQFDAVFLSQQDPLHLGGLPFLVNNGLSCPVYATELVKCMGHISCYDLVQSEEESHPERQLYSLDAVDVAFERIKEVRYNQVLSLQGRIGTRLQVTAMQAGHMIGGTVWKVVKEGQDAIVYASQVNHRREWHLDSSALPSIMRPHLLLLNAPNTLQHISIKNRDDTLLKAAQETVRRGGNMLLCCDTAGRVLELIYMLEQLWRRQDTGLMAYNLVLCSPVAFNVVNFASLRLEWLNQKVMRAFEATRANPFAARFLQVIHSLDELSSIHGPKVVIATYPSLETGFARDLFSMWAGNSKNTVFFATKPPLNSLGRRLLERSCKGERVEVRVSKRVGLEGAELTAWEERQKEKKTEERWMEEKMSDDEEEEEEEEGDEVVVHDSYPADGTFMYPHKETALRWDHYGVHVDLAGLFDTASRKPRPSLPQNPSPSHPQDDLPFKTLVSTQAIEVRCEVLSEDFEGTSDVVSIIRILHLVRPRHLMFMGHHGNRMSKLFDSSHLPDTTQLHLASPHQCIDVSSDSQMLQLRLKDSLLGQLHFTPLEGSDVQVTYFSAHVSSDAQPSEVCVEQGEEEEERVMSFSHLPPHTPTPLHPQVFINRPILSEVKAKVVEAGINAEMVGGVLLCDDRVVVKKTDSGKYLIEGQPCKLYYQVRKALYECFVIV